MPLEMIPSPFLHGYLVLKLIHQNPERGQLNAVQHIINVRFAERIAHNLIRGKSGENSYGIFLGPIFQNTRLTRNIVCPTGAGLVYLFKNHGPVLIDNNVFFLADSLKIRS